MAGFTPMQSARGFHVGLIAGDRKTAPVPDAEDVAADVDGLDQPVSPMPSTPEELEAMLEEARQKAREDAAMVLAQDRAALKEDRAQVMRLIEHIESGRAAWGDEVRNVLGELVIVGVRQVVGESADLQEAMLRDRFAEVGERLIGESAVVVRVRPEDESSANALLGGREGWTVVLDADISGGLVAETDAGKVDATLGAAVAGLTEAVQAWQAEGVGEE